MKKLFSTSISDQKATIEEESASMLIPVTVQNFERAETDLYFSSIGVRDGGFGKFSHNREPTPVEKQTVIRMNRDTLYSAAVFDLNAGPVTVSMPDPGKRFMSLMAVNEDHYVIDVRYESGNFTYRKEDAGTRYLCCAIRTLVDPGKPGDLEEVHALQDKVRSAQANSGKFEIPAWDKISQDKVREALLVLKATIAGFTNAFGKKGEVDPVMHLLGTAAGWGGNPDKEASYLDITPTENDGKTIYQLTVKDVPVDGFWSISVYNADGYFEKNDQDAYSINSLTAKRNDDGSINIQFGGCNASTTNCIPISEGWNYLVRLYRPRKEVLDGTWKFPDAMPVQ